MARTLFEPTTINKFDNESRIHVIRPRFDAVTHNGLRRGALHGDSRLKDVTHRIKLAAPCDCAARRPSCTS
jgi:hypothetical protein